MTLDVLAGPSRIAPLMELIRASLTRDLLKKEYLEGNLANPLYGYCYVASEALYYFIRALLLPDEYLAYEPWRGTDGTGGTHWWLQNSDGDILDVTAGQYAALGIQAPYENAGPCAFESAHCSRRTAALLKRVGTI